MATRTETKARRRDLAKAREAGSELCDAVAQWVRALGGVPLNVRDLRAKETSKGRYRVSVIVRGTWPRKKYALK